MIDALEIKKLLSKIQRSHGEERTASIGVLQDLIWNEEEFDNETLEEVLSNLAYDLNFYESETRDRDESLGYYGDQHLVEVIEAANEKLDLYIAGKLL